MKRNMKHLNDEHMRLYEWSGLGAQMASLDPAKSKRTHPWHASYSVLAVLTSLLILNGCDRQHAVEQASEQVGQALQEPKEQPLYEEAGTQPAQAEAAAPAGEEMPGQAGEQAVQPGKEPD
jgi:hypothetical protein